MRERLDVTYNGITNWVFYARGELTEGSGTLAETGGLIPINGIGVQPVNYNSQIDRFFQKYSAGARWYPDSPAHPGCRGILPAQQVRL